MNRLGRRLSSCAVALYLVLSVAAAAAAAPPQGVVAFTVSTPAPATHLFHVVMRCDALPGADETIQFHMPVWTPGYYGLFDYAANVRSFAASDAAGAALTWEKTGPNAWTVHRGRARNVELTYDVAATSQFVANIYLDENRGYITPGALFLYIPGRIKQQARVTIDLNPRWTTVATGLDLVPGAPAHTFVASDFDVLYDSPILMGNLETLPTFEIRGVPHRFVGYNLGDFDRPKFIEALKAVVEAGTRIIGDIPYKHYTFLAIGPGQGGIEHLNSTAFGFSGKGLNDRAGMNRTLAFLAHEYFHNYNVKRIRPIALGPFDYDKANVTNMLWVSEGFTSYYEYLLLARSGAASEDDVLVSAGRTIAAYENSTGHLFQSATESSRETWNQGPFGRSGGGVRKTISYYDKGAALGMLLDFKIRHETKNQRSLDTIMRALYQDYYKKLGRGWTDEEFRAVCERVAGTRLDEIFDYAATTHDVDYGKYLGYAGLELEPPTELPDAWLGAIVEDKNGRPAIAAVESGSPAAAAGLKAGDVIAAVDGATVDAAAFDRAIAAKRSAVAVSLAIASGDQAQTRTLNVTLAHKLARSFKIRRMAQLTPLQATILKNWTAPNAK